MMNDFLRQAFSPSIRQVRWGWVEKMLAVILLGAIGINGLYVLVRLSFGEPFLGPSIIVNFSLLVLQVGLFLLLRHGYVQLATIVLLASTWAGMTYQAWFSEGVRDTAVTVYIVIILACALVTNLRVTVVITVLSILSIWGMVLGEITGLRSSRFDSPFSTALELSAIFLLVILLVYLVTYTVRRSNVAKQESEEKFSRVFQVSPVAICITTLKDGRLLDANPAYWNLTGLDPDNSVGKTTVELELWDSDSERQKFSQKLQEKKSFKNPGYVFENVSGEGRVTAAFYELVDSGSEPTVLSMFYDVTEQVAAQHALRASEEKYRNFVEKSVEGIWFVAFDEPIPTDFPPEEQVKIIHQTGYVQDCNDSLARMYGYENREQVIGKRLLEMYGGIVSETNLQSALKLVKSNYSSAERETVEETADGRKVHFLNNAIGVMEGGYLVGIWGTQVDITATKKMQEALKQGEDRTRALLKAIPDMIFEINREGVILQFVPSSTINPLLPPEEFIGKNINQVMPPDVVEQTMFAIQRTLESGLLQVFEYQLPEFDKQSYFEASVIRSDADSVIAMVRDVTARKWAMTERENLIDELEMKNAELEQYTYTVSHDLKSPLITITGFLGYLREDVERGNRERIEIDIERINVATWKMQKLLGDLLELSRVGRLVNEPENVDLDQLLLETTEMLHGRITEGNIQLQVERDLPTVQVDRQRILEVFQNLLDNSAKFMGDQTNPKITIGMSGYNGKMPVLYVRDNGMGIEPEYHERIFGLFNRLNPLIDGTGIGLALVKRIIEFHGGRIWVESEAGRGATFYFTLPPAASKPG